MQIQCPKCKEWTDSETGTCQNCSHRFYDPPVTNNAYEIHSDRVRPPQNQVTPHPIIDPPPYSRIKLHDYSQRDKKRNVIFILLFILIFVVIPIILFVKATNEYTDKKMKEFHEKLEQREKQEQKQKQKQKIEDLKRKIEENRALEEKQLQEELELQDNHADTMPQM